MDLLKINTEETHWDDEVDVVLYDDAGEPEQDSKGTAVTLWVVGEFSKRAKRMAQIQKPKISALLRRYGSWERIPQADMDALNDETMAACITRWQGFESGKDSYPYSSENAVALVAMLRAHKPNHLRQLDGAIKGHASFFTKPSAS